MTEEAAIEKTVRRFRVYCVALGVVYAVVAFAGVSLAMAPHLAGDFGEGPVRVLGMMLAAVGLPILGLAVLGWNMPRREGAWLFNLLVILTGFASVVLVPFGVFLLRAWLRPETREWYGANHS